MPTTPKPTTKLAPPSQPKFRGQVSLARSAETLDDCMSSVCCVDSSHLTLLGGDELDLELFKMTLGHLGVKVHTENPRCFSIKTSQNSHIFIFVASQAARDRWLSVLSEKDVAIAGWDASKWRQPSRRFAPAPLFLGRQRLPNLVIWLS